MMRSVLDPCHKKYSSLIFLVFAALGDFYS
jgi:hypothetical protein